MDQLKGEVFDSRKDPVVLGTFESSAFILSLKDAKELSEIHSFGYHRIPHIGVYGHDYTPALPMVLLSLPPLPKCLQRLPSDLLNALDLTEVVAQKETAMVHTPPATKLQLLQQEILKEHADMNPEDHNRLVARELVSIAITSACRKLGLNGSTFLCATDQERHGSSPGRVRELGMGDRGGESLQPNSDTENTVSFTNYRDVKRDSTVSFMSVESESSRRESFMSQCSSIDRTELLVGLDSGIDIPRDGNIGGTSGDSQQVSTMEDNDIAVQTVAKKLVKKALHLACKRWEAMFRRCSIEYLVANTKRMRITDSPSPPPTLVEEDGLHAAKRTDRISKSTEPRLDDKSEESPTHSWEKRGTKRARSESHDIFMMKELERFRESQLVELDHRLGGNDSPSRRPLAKPKPRTVTGELKERSGRSTFLQPPPSVGVNTLISDIGRMSIAEGNSESDGERYESDQDEEYTILTAVTKTAPTPVSPCSFNKPGNGGTADHVKGGCDYSSDDMGKSFSRKPRSNMLSVPQPSVPVLTVNGRLIHDRTKEGKKIISNPEAKGNLPSQPGMHTEPEIEPATSNDLCQPLSDIDLFIIVHTHPVPGVCQKFLCNNTNEVNLMYHCWLFPEMPFDPSITVSETLEVGVFDPEGIQPVHLDLDDAGVAFHYLDRRTVCIHGCHFSPENAQLQLVRGAQLHTFFSAAKCDTRTVVAFHVVPGTENVEHTVRQCISKSSTLRQLLFELSSWFPEVGQRLVDLISSLSK